MKFKKQIKRITSGCLVYFLGEDTLTQTTGKKIQKLIIHKKPQGHSRFKRWGNRFHSLIGEVVNALWSFF